jgi:hypothetical protein
LTQRRKQEGEAEEQAGRSKGKDKRRKERCEGI